MTTPNTQAIVRAMNEAMVATFVEWELAGVTHVALGCQGFEPITPREASCTGRRAYDVRTEQEAIVRSMLERARAAIEQTKTAVLAAALTGKGGSA